MARKRLGWLVGVVVPAVLVAVGVGSVVSQGGPRPVRHMTSFPSQPIPGVKIDSLKTAANLASFPIPALPEAAIADPCTGEEAAVHLLAVWASPQSVEEGSRQVGMTYSMGIWMSLSPLSGYDERIQTTGELGVLKEAFSSDDFPEGLRDDSVRGHTAWSKDVSPTFGCDKTASVEVPRPVHSPGIAEESQAQPPQASPGVMYDPTEIGNISWAEGGAVIEIAGPFSASVLRQLAQGIVFV